MIETELEKEEKTELVETNTPDLSGIHVLLVEDNELNIEIAKFMIGNIDSKKRNTGLKYKLEKLNKE